MNPDQTPASASAPAIDQTSAAAQPAAPAPVTPAAYESNPFKLIKPSFEAFKLCWANIVLAFLAFIGAFVALAVLFGIGSFLRLGSVFNILVFLIVAVTVIYLPMTLSWMVTKAVLAAVRGQKIALREALPTHWTDPLKLLWTQIVVGFLTILGFLLLIIPGFVALGFWSFAPTVTVDTGEWGWAALKKSREIVRGRIWEIFGALFMPSIVALITLIPFIGNLIYFVFAIVITPYLVVRYQSMLDLKAQPDWQSVPVSPWNYATLAIGIVAAGITNYTNYQNSQHLKAPVEINQKAY